MAGPGRRIANVLLLGGVLLAALLGALVFVGSHVLVLPDDATPETSHTDAGEVRRERPRRERVARSEAPAVPAGNADPADVPPGTPPAPVRVHGRVLGPDGEPLAGIAVAVGRTWVAVGDDGAFDAEVRDGGSWRVDVLAPGFRLAEPLHVDDAAEPVVVRLVPDRDVVVRGLVTDSEGRPLADAHVRIAVYRTKRARDAFARDFDLEGVHEAVDALRASFEPETTTRADGAYELRVPAVTRHFRVVAWADGHTSEASDPVHVVAGRDTYDVSLQVRTYRTLRGRVLDADTLLPVEGATVTTWLSPRGQPGEDAVTTDAAGEFTIDDAPRSDVFVLADGYLRSKSYQAPDVPVLEVRLFPARVIEGHVRFSDGTPVHGAYVTVNASALRDPPGVQLPGPVVTGEDGAFRFEAVWKDAWTVSAFLTQYARVNFLTTDVADVTPGGGEVVVIVQRARAIAGRVLGPGDEPLAGVYVSCERSGRDPAQRPVHGDGAGTRTDSEGRFELRGLRDGAFRVSATVTPPGMPSYLPAHADAVAAGAGDVVLRMTLGLSLRGRVVDEEGAPVADRRVLAIDPEHVGLAYDAGKAGTTGDDGRFEIVGLDDRAYRLQLKPLAPEWARCYLEGGESVRPGDDDLALRLSTGGEISGIVLDDAGNPVADAEVQAVPMEEPSRIESRTRTDPRGCFTVRGLVRTRRYRLHGGGKTLDDVSPGTRDVRLD